ncbi:MAG: hypothetical protein CMI09_16445 [Oceanospirillaceae bacterium]|nr:hypothetical protein [Oceanospirillaceae bacterium]
MHIRKKLLSGLVLLFALVAGSIVLTVHYMVLPGIAEAEREELVREIDRVKHAIRGELSRMKSFAIDWGEWDDTYAYIQSPNPGYEASNLLGSTLGDVETHAIILLNNQGRVVKRLESAEIFELALMAGNHWDNSHPIIKLMQDSGTGLLKTAQGPLLIAGNPIRRSNGEGPDRGYIVFGRFLDQDLREAFSNDLVLPLALSVVPTPEHGLASLVVFKDINASQITGYLELANDGDSVLQLSVMHDRPFYTSALKLVSVSMVLLLLVGTLMTGIAYVLIRRTLVDPILTLKTQTELFKRSKSSLGIEEIRQHDELGALSRSFVDMVRELEASNNVLEQERQKFLDDSLTDPLTRLGNRRFLQQYLNAQAKAGRGEWLFVMVDLDHFKKVNDRYGHDVGDEVLVEVASLLTDINRRNDVVTRYGGEEFVVICRGVGKDTAASIVERIRENLEGHVFYSSLDEGFNLTCSIGFFVLDTDGVRVTREWSSILKVADLAMYAAKNSGRNTWVGVTPADKECSGHYPTSPEQIESCINQKHLLVLTFRRQPLHWGRQETSACS